MIWDEEEKGVLYGVCEGFAELEADVCSGEPFFCNGGELRFTVRTNGKYYYDKYTKEALIAIDVTTDNELFYDDKKVLACCLAFRDLKRSKSVDNYVEAKTFMQTKNNTNRSILAIPVSWINNDKISIDLVVESEFLYERDYPCERYWKWLFFDGCGCDKGDSTLKERILEIEFNERVGDISNL